MKLNKASKIIISLVLIFFLLISGLFYWHKQAQSEIKGVEEKSLPASTGNIKCELSQKTPSEWSGAVGYLAINDNSLELVQARSLDKIKKETVFYINEITDWRLTLKKDYFIGSGVLATDGVAIEKLTCHWDKPIVLTLAENQIGGKKEKYSYFDIKLPDNLCSGLTNPFKPFCYNNLVLVEYGRDNRIFPLRSESYRQAKILVETEKKRLLAEKCVDNKKKLAKDYLAHKPSSDCEALKRDFWLLDLSSISRSDIIGLENFFSSRFYRYWKEGSSNEWANLSFYIKDNKWHLAFIYDGGLEDFLEYYFSSDYFKKGQENLRLDLGLGYTDSYDLRILNVSDQAVFNNFIREEIGYSLERKSFLRDDSSPWKIIKESNTSLGYNSFYQDVLAPEKDDISAKEGVLKLFLRDSDHEKLRNFYQSLRLKAIK